MREPSRAVGDDYVRVRCRMMTEAARAASRCAVPIFFVLFANACFSSSEGASGAGGSSTTGGTPDGGIGGAKEELIDDMNDGDGSILVASGRVGAWYTYNDATPSAM